MKISTKLVISFVLVAALVVLVGFFGFTAITSIQENNAMQSGVAKLVDLLDDSLVQVLQLVETDNVEEYTKIKSNIEHLRVDFDRLSKETSFLSGLEGFEDFELTVADFTTISNGIIAVHKEKLGQDKEFSEKQKIARDVRHKLPGAILAIHDLTLTEQFGFMQYYSKEAIYQYKDQEHLDEWFASIQAVRNTIESLSIDQTAKDILLRDLRRYEEAADTMGEIVLDQKEAEKSLQLKVGALGDIVSRLKEQKEAIGASMNAASQVVARRAFVTLVTAIIIALAGSLLLGMFLARAIAGPLAQLSTAAEEIGKGNLKAKIKIHTRDELADLGKSLHRMALNLERSQKKLLESERKRKKELEAEVKKKTKELQKRLHELEKWRKLTTDREVKMIALKKKIRELEGRK